MDSSTAAVVPLVRQHAQECHPTSMYSAAADLALVLHGAWVPLNPRPNKECEKVEKEAHREPKWAHFLGVWEERIRGKGGL